MTYIEAEKRVQELTTLLEKYNYEYYVLIHRFRSRI